MLCPQRCLNRHCRERECGTTPANLGLVTETNMNADTVAVGDMTWTDLLVLSGIEGVDAKPEEGIEHLYYWIPGERHLYVESHAPRFTGDIMSYTTELQAWIFTAIVHRLPQVGDSLTIRNPGDHTHDVRITRLEVSDNLVKLRIDRE